TGLLAHRPTPTPTPAVAASVTPVPTAGEGEVGALVDGSEYDAVLDPDAGPVGFLKISVPNSWAEVSIDGASIGYTPIARPIKLSAGSHRLLLKRDGWLSGEATVE